MLYSNAAIGIQMACVLDRAGARRDGGNSKHWLISAPFSLKQAQRAPAPAWALLHA